MLGPEAGSPQPRVAEGWRLRAGFAGLSSLVLVAVALSYSPAFNGRPSAPQELYAMIPGQRDPYMNLGGRASSELSSYNHILSFNPVDSEVSTPKREDLEPVESQMKDSNWARRYLKTGQLFRGENAATADLSGVDCFYTHPVEECERRTKASQSLSVAASQDGDGTQDVQFDADCFYHHSVDFCMKLKSQAAHATLGAQPQVLHDRPRRARAEEPREEEPRSEQPGDEEPRAEERREAERRDQEAEERRDEEARAEEAERARAEERRTEEPSSKRAREEPPKGTGAKIVERDARDEESFETGRPALPIEDVRHTEVAKPIRESARKSEVPETPEQRAKAQVHQMAMERKFSAQASTSRNFSPSAADHPGVWARSYTDTQVAWDLAHGVTPIDASEATRPILRVERPAREMSLTDAFTPQRLTQQQLRQRQAAVSKLRKQALADGYNIEPITGDGVGALLRQEEKQSTSWSEQHGIAHNSNGDYANERHGLTDAAYLKPASESLQEGERTDGSWDQEHGVLKFYASNRQTKRLGDFEVDGQDPLRVARSQRVGAESARAERLQAKAERQRAEARIRKAQSRLVAKADTEASEIGSAGIEALGFSSMHRFEKHLEKEGV